MPRYRSESRDRNRSRYRSPSSDKSSRSSKSRCPSPKTKRKSSPSNRSSRKETDKYTKSRGDKNRHRYSKSRSPSSEDGRNNGHRYEFSKTNTDDKYSKSRRDRDRHSSRSSQSRSPSVDRKSSRYVKKETDKYDKVEKEREKSSDREDYARSSRLEKDKKYRRNSEDRDRDTRSTKNRGPSKEIKKQKSPQRSQRDRRGPSKEIKKQKSSQRSQRDRSKSRSDRKKDRSKEKKKAEKSDSSSRSSSSSSASSEDSVKLLKMLEKERLKAIEAKRKAKELLKATETAEEKRLRRLAKKQEKERKRKERMGWDNEYLHYTNSDNPFGDGNLLSTFVWQKKLAKEGLSDASHEVLESRNRMKQEENKQELEKVKKRRLERELERQKREEENQLLQRKKEAEQFKEWERQEDQFHLEQARLRSHIRIQDGRAKPIDLLAKYISAEEEVDAVEMHEPYTYLNGLHIKDLEDLVEDIKVYMELEKGRNLDYWNDITIIVEDELQKLRKIEKDHEFEYGVNRREGINQAVAQDITSVFKGKTAAQLEALQKNIESKISGKADGIDIGYWESLLSQLKAHMARARLRDRHQESLKRKLEVLKAEQSIPVSTDTAAPPEQAGTSRDSVTDENSSQSDENDENEMTNDDSVANDMLDECFTAYISGNYSPRLMQNDEIEPGTIVFNEEDDSKRLEFTRLQVTDKGKKVENIVTKEELILRKEAQKGMGEDEAQFSVESALDPQIYLWSDKYRPRKPRYFNRVHTGFEWNKYNQTHYDMDNPPPKIVQGYKFNIFYPDLIDKNCTPEYFLTPCPENREFAILKFHAGPPYEDIAFKIVNREWEYSYKRGFRCQFHNNIFQLWFHFKRYRYRR